MAFVRVSFDPAAKPSVVAIVTGLSAGIALGGAGVSYPWLSAMPLLIAIAALCWLLPKLARRRIPAITLAALLGLLAVVLLPLLQLVPLPWDVWTALPGRSLAAAIRTQAGLAGSASPLSLRPDATLQALLALLPPCAAFVAVVLLDERGRIAVLRALVALALLSAILGALQLASGGTGSSALFDSAHRGDALGLFVNHNHSATFLLIGMVAAAVPATLDGRGRAGGQWPAALGIIALLALAVLGTTSRTGLLTLAPVLLLCSYLRFPGAWRSKWLLAGSILLAAAVVALAQTPLAQTSLARFDTVDQDGRHLFWANTLYAIGLFLPWGSGLGSFTTIYPMVEPLDQLRVPIVNHAHNEYLELALEGGIPALVLIAGGLGLAGFAFVRALPRRGASPWQARPLTLAAGAIVAIVLLHSVVDYPLRMPALSIAFAACLAMLFPRGRRGRGAGLRPRAFGLVTALCLGVGLLLAWQVVQVAAASRLLLRGVPAQALRWQPGRAEAWSGLAAWRARGADWDGSAQAARTALAQAPLDAVAVRVLGLAAAATQREESAGRLMLLGGQLGWRDVPTQLWLIQRALELQDPLVAVQRADGLLRQQQQTALLFGQLRRLLGDATGSKAVANALALRPTWRQAFLASLGHDAQLRGDDIGRLYRELAAGGVPVDTIESGPLLDGLWRAGRYQEARAIWRAAGSTGLIGDPGFEQGAGDLRGIGPFSWQSASTFGVRAGIDTPGSAWRGRALRVESSGIGTGPAVRQRLVLAPGAYVLRFVVRLDGETVARPSWEMACAPGFAAPAASPEASWMDAGRGWLRGELRFDIGEGCLAQELRLVVPPAKGGWSAWLDDVGISSASRK